MLHSVAPCMYARAGVWLTARMKPSHDDLLHVSPVGLNTAALAWVPLFAKREPELLEAEIRPRRPSSRVSHRRAVL